MQKGSHLTDLVAYLQTARQTLSAPGTSLEQREGMIDGLFEEINDKELMLACSQRGSKQIQHLLGIVNPDQATDILGRIVRGGNDALCNQYASHVIQAGISKLVMSDFSKLAIEIVDLLQNDLEYLVYHTCATHVLRSFILACGGFASLDKHNPTELPEDQQHYKQQGKTQQLRLPESAVGSVQEVALDRLVDLFSPLLIETPMKLLCSPQASPTIQVLILVIGRQRPEAITPLLSGLIESVPSLLDDSVGSHAVETLIEVASRSNKKMFRKITAAVLSSQSRFAGYAIQSCISASKEEKDLVNIIKHATSFESSNTGSSIAVYQRLATAALEFKSIQQPLIQKIQRPELLPYLLTIQATANWSNIETNRPHPGGALLVSTLFKFDQENVSEDTQADAAHLADHIDWLCKHKPTSRVLETILSKESCINASTRTIITKALLPKLHDLAIDLKSGGSWIVGSAVAGASNDPELRRALCEVLIEVEGLRDLNFRLWKLCSLGDFKSAPQKWEQGQKRKQHATELFADIINDPKKKRM